MKKMNLLRFNINLRNKYEITTVESYALRFKDMG